MTEQLALKRLAHWVEKCPDAVWLSQPVNGQWHDFTCAQVDAQGYVKIIGRLKDIFKTSKGKYIAPAPIEGEIAKNLWVEPVCLMGSNLDQPLALIELSPAAHEQACEQVAADLAQTLAQLNAPLEAHERVSHFILAREAWTVDNGCMTPTMKIRRNVLESRVADQLSELDAKQPLHWQLDVCFCRRQLAVVRHSDDAFVW